MRRHRDFTYVNQKGQPCDKNQALLGSGGFSSTYRQKNTLDQRIYAVKSTHNTTTTQEAIILARLSHPNIIRYFQSFTEDETRLHLVLELCGKGLTLCDLLGPKAWSIHPRIMRQLFNAVTYLHHCCILHRDIKSSNCLIHPRTGQLKLTDFGHAIDLQKPEATYQPIPQTSGRSHYVYRAPEVLRGKPYSYPSDLFQIGAVFIELGTELTLDEIVGNSSKSGWNRTFADWSQTEEYPEALDDIREKRHVTPLAELYIDLTAHDPETRKIAHTQLLKHQKKSNALDHIPNKV
jgi:serine/threonine protein kinase